VKEAKRQEYQDKQERRTKAQIVRVSTTNKPKIEPTTTIESSRSAFVPQPPELPKAA